MPVLREVLRHYQAFRSVFETDGVDTLTGPDGFEISLWDVEYLVQSLSLLPPRQRQAIQFCLIENMKETDAAVRMGVSPTNPVAMYAASGLSKIIAMIQAGQLPRFRMDQEREAG